MCCVILYWLIWLLHLSSRDRILLLLILLYCVAFGFILYHSSSLLVCLIYVELRIQWQPFSFLQIIVLSSNLTISMLHAQLEGCPVQTDLLFTFYRFIILIGEKYRCNSFWQKIIYAVKFVFGGYRATCRLQLVVALEVVDDRSKFNRIRCFSRFLAAIPYLLLSSRYSVWEVVFEKSRFAQRENSTVEGVDFSERCLAHSAKEAVAYWCRLWQSSRLF